MNIVSWSGGKDSTATIILAHEQGIHIDLIIISLLWFDKKRGIYAEYPEQIKWIFDYAIPLFNSWGYKVHIIESKRDYMYWFNHIIEDSDIPERIGKKAGFVLGGKCYMNREKTRPIHKFIYNLRKNTPEKIVEYVGITADEPERLSRLYKKKGKISLLAQQKFTQKMSYKKCVEYGLLSPMYRYFKRGGCWFCPNQHISGFAHLKLNYPYLWQELVNFSKTPGKVSENFKYSKTFPQVSDEVDRYIQEQRSESK